MSSQFAAVCEEKCELARSARGGDGFGVAGFGEDAGGEVVEDGVGGFVQGRLQGEEAFQVALGPGDRQAWRDAAIALPVEDEDSAGRNTFISVGRERNDHFAAQSVRLVDPPDEEHY